MRLDLKENYRLDLYLFMFVFAATDSAALSVRSVCSSNLETQYGETETELTLLCLDFSLLWVWDWDWF